MTISDDQGLASFIREGDYFAVTGSPKGISVEYSPDGSINNPITGAFAYLKGTVYLLDAEEAATTLAAKREDAEEFLLREVRRQLRSSEGRLARAGLMTKGAKVEEKETLRNIIIRLVASYAQEYESGGGYWEGSLPSFHSDVVCKLHPCPLDSKCLRILKTLDQWLPGIKITREAKGLKGVWFRVDWAMVASET